eukprot:gene6479-3112_t
MLDNTATFSNAEGFRPVWTQRGWPSTPSRRTCQTSGISDEEATPRLRPSWRAATRLPRSTSEWRYP